MTRVKPYDETEDIIAPATNKNRSFSKNKSEADKKISDIKKRLTKEQRNAYTLAVEEGENLFISGNGGTGKSFLLDSIVQTLRDKYHKNVMVCAFTGVAAHHINGTTIHKQFGFPIGVCLKKLASEKYQPIAKANKALKNTDVLVLDECSMIRIDVFDSICKSMEKANKVRKEEGKNDIQVIILGDFFQLGCVITDEDRRILEEHYCSEKTCIGGKLKEGYPFNSIYWNKLNLKNILLKETLRQKDDEFVYHLNQIRVGTPGFSHYFNQKTNPNKIEDAISIFPYNFQVDKRNAEKLAKIEGPAKTFEAKLSGRATEEDCGRNYSLTIKVGAKVMFTASDNPSLKGDFDLIRDRPDAFKGRTMFVNGSRGEISDIVENPMNPDDDYINIKLNDSGEFVKILRNRYPVEEYVEQNGSLQRKKIGEYKQFPLMLAYSCTVHRSQGLSLWAININPKMFSAGQAYVGLSRCKYVETIHLEQPIMEEDIKVDPDVVNFYNNLSLS